MFDVGRHGVVTLVGLDGIVRARRAGDATDVGQDITPIGPVRRARKGAAGALPR